MGKYAALTAMGTFIILNPKKAQAQSAAPGGESDDSDARVILHLRLVGGISETKFLKI